MGQSGCGQEGSTSTPKVDDTLYVILGDESLKSSIKVKRHICWIKLNDNPGQVYQSFSKTQIISAHNDRTEHVDIKCLVYHVVDSRCLRIIYKSLHITGTVLPHHDDQISVSHNRLSYTSL